MKERNFIDIVTGENSTVPWSPEDALLNKYTRWMDRTGCERCNFEGRGNGKKVRYLKNNQCTFCFIHDVHKLWPQWSQGDPGRPTPWVISPEESVNLKVDWYYGSPSHNLACTNGPHLRKTSIVTGRCIDCDRDNAYFRALLKGPRAAARAQGEKYYVPTEACPECDTFSKRHVVTNGCTGCSETNSDNRTSASQVFAKQNPDFIISRDSAKALGFTLFRTGEPCRRNHTGWRYVSTTNCLDCLNLK
jgi:hypothetical protein